jgi:hypothetical protein
MKSSIILAVTVVTGIVIACGGSTDDPLLGGAGTTSSGGSTSSSSSSSSGTSGSSSSSTSSSSTSSSSSSSGGDCDTVKCAACPQGQRSLPQIPGRCCGCEVDPNYCTTQKNAFDEWLKNRLAQPGALDCQVKEDCAMINVTNKCSASCGTGVAKTQASQIENAAKKFGEDNCKSCPPPSTGCPAVVLSPRCDPNTHKCTLAPG